MTSPILRFLLAGGLAAAINWLARIALSAALPFAVAIAVAYLIGMGVGFVLYRHFVFDGTRGTPGRQVPAFLLVNGLGAAIVLASAIGLDGLLAAVAPAIRLGIREAFAHGAAIAVGAVFNYLGHKFVTFASVKSLPKLTAGRMPVGR